MRAGWVRPIADGLDGGAMEVTVSRPGVSLPATIDLPDGPVRGGVVALHSASDGQRSFFCYRHLGEVLAREGVAVLRYDRRPSASADVPLAVQAADALAAVAVLRARIGEVPIGLWGFSQGAWAASLAAATHPGDIAFLVLVSGSGVSPAAQMRYGCAEQLRRRGFGAADLADLARLRSAVEEHQRGALGRDVAQAVVDECADRPWFDLVHVPRRLPAAPGGWADMDYDPAQTFAAVTCPVLAFYGERDEWVPIDDSIAALEDARGGGIELSIHRLEGCDHHPTLDDRRDIEGISPDYTQMLTRWIDGQLRPR